MTKTAMAYSCCCRNVSHDQGRELRRYTHGLYERASSYENRYDEEGNCIERIYYDNEGNVTDRVQNPSPELSFRYIYRPDY